MISLGLVESNVFCMFDSVRGEIIVPRMVEGILKTKENTLSRMNINFSITTISRKGIETAAENAKESEIGMLASANGNGRFSAITMGNTIVEKDEML